MDDLIRRQDAIDVFDDYNAVVNNGDYGAYTHYLGRMRDIPTVETEINWTPTTKKAFPDEEGEYLVTVNGRYEFKSKELKPITIAMDYVRTTVRGKPVERWEWKNKISPWGIIAWAPMPEPYKEESNG